MFMDFKLPRFTVCADFPEALVTPGKSSAMRAGDCIVNPVGGAVKASVKSIFRISTPPCTLPAIALIAPCAAAVRDRSASVMPMAAGREKVMDKLLICFIFFSLLQIERCHAFYPISGCILCYLAQLNRVFGDLDDFPIVLPKIIAHMNLINQILNPQQGGRSSRFVQAANHGHGVQRKCLQRLFAPRQLGGQQRCIFRRMCGVAVRTPCQFPWVERIHDPVLGIKLGNELFRLAQRCDTGAGVGALLDDPLAQFILAAGRTSRQHHRQRQQQRNAKILHHFAPPAFFCAWTSSGSRYLKVRAVASSVSILAPRAPVGAMAMLFSVTMRERCAMSAANAPISWYLPETRMAMGNSA